MKKKPDKSISPIEKLYAWYQKPLGQKLLKIENEALDQILPNLFGYHLVQLGQLFGQEIMRASLINHRVIIGDSLPVVEKPDTHISDIGTIAKSHSLPIQKDCIDVVVLPHTLEFSEDPHEVLREVDRILVPEGHVVIMSFNPLSIWGFWYFFHWRRKKVIPWCGKFKSILRIKDWLALLGYDMVSTQTLFYRPPFIHEGLMNKLTFLEAMGKRWFPLVGGIYILVAKKRMTTLTPIKPRWRRKPGLVEADVVKPTT